LTAVLLVTAAASGAAQVRAGDSLPVPRTEQAPVIDGLLDDPAWTGAAVLDQWVQTRPGDNSTPSGRTAAYITYDRDHLYIAVRAWDIRSRVRYRLHERDNIVMQGQDWVGFRIDTWNDRRRAFGFASNPIGVQGDGVEVEGSGRTEWDAEFDTEGKLLEDGWSVEFRIPFSSLRYPGRAEHRWGLMLTRTYGRENLEDSPWPKDRNLACLLCHMITLTGIRDIAPGRRVEFNPTAVGHLTSERPSHGDPFGPTDSEVEFGANIKVAASPGLTLDGTVNPDFSQIEADAGQLELNNRFALFFPERRPFFLEGADIFQTRIALSGSEEGFNVPPINLIHTRQIVDPEGGLKVSGKAGRAGIGVIAALDDYLGYTIPDSVGGLSPEELDPYYNDRAADATGRVKVDVLKDGYVGATATYWALGGKASALGSLDGRLRFGDNASVRFLGALSDTEEPDAAGPAYDRLFSALGDSGLASAAFDSLPEEFQDLDGETRNGAALQAQGEWASRHWQFGLGYLDITPGFETRLGFTPRTDFILLTGGARYIYRGTGFFRQVRPGVRIEQGYEHGDDHPFSFGARTDFRLDTGVDVDLPGATRAGTGWSRNFTRFEEIDFPDMDRAYLFVSSQVLSQLSFFGFFQGGEDLIYSDEVDEGDPLPAFSLQAHASVGLRPFPPIRVELSLAVSRIWRRSETELQESKYGESAIPRVTVRGQITRRLGLRAIGEYRLERFYARNGDLAGKRESSLLDVLVSYVIHPNQSVQLGWSQSGEGDLEDSWQWVRRGGLAKLSYVWRF
jgi:hypothetical protein